MTPPVRVPVIPIVRPAEITDTKYMRFERVEIKGRKTPVVFVISKSSGVQLGRIAWFAQWRQFCFWPEAATVFNSECMHDIQEQIAKLRGERRGGADEG